MDLTNYFHVAFLTNIYIGNKCIIIRFHFSEVVFSNSKCFLINVLIMYFICFFYEVGFN